MHTCSWRPLPTAWLSMRAAWSPVSSSSVPTCAEAVLSSFVYATGIKDEHCIMTIIQRPACAEGILSTFVYETGIKEEHCITTRRRGIGGPLSAGSYVTVVGCHLVICHRHWISLVSSVCIELGNSAMKACQDRS